MAIEIISRSDTVREMDRKRKELFAGGTKLMWIIDPPTRTVADYVDAESSAVVLNEDQSIDGGSVLERFSFSIHQLLAEADLPKK